MKHLDASILIKLNYSEKDRDLKSCLVSSLNSFDDYENECGY